MTDIVSFGEWVQSRRNQLGLTRAGLARQVGCAADTIKKIERDERRPSVQIAQLLAEHLKILEAEQADFIRWARGQSVSGRGALPGPVSQVTSPPQRPHFLDEAAPEIPPPIFVAREHELALLAATLAAALKGQGQVQFVIGGAGRGKTMLVQAFARQAQATMSDLLVVNGNCNAYTGLGDPYLPFREALALLTGDLAAQLAGGLISQQHGQRLWQAMPLTIPALVEKAPDLIDTFVPNSALQSRAAAFAPAAVPRLNQLVNLAAPQSAGVKQERIFAQYAAVLKTVAARQPLLLIIEDLHWVDLSSSSLLFYLSRQIHDSPILIIGTYRPDEVALSRGEGQHPMADIVGELKRQYGDIWLDLAEVADGRYFVDAFLDTQPNRLDEGFRQAMFAHTGGHALFTVELLREMQARGDLQKDEAGCWIAGDRLDWQTLPPKVEGVIEQRINRLEEALRSMLTIASVEGESFTAEVVARIQALNEWQLVQRLSRELDKQHRLVIAQALERLGQQWLSLYRFRHHLFQHYLYHRLAETERVYLHREVGLALETLYGDEAERIAVQLARHFAMAGLIAKAINYLQKAGQQASRRSAHTEAISHLTRALDLLSTLPVTPEHTEQELALQIDLGVQLQITKGLAAPEVGQAYARAQELCQQIEETPQLFPTLWGLWLFYTTRAEHQTALNLAQQLWNMAQQAQDSTLVLLTHRALGSTYFWLGELNMAREHLDQVISRYHPQQHQATSSSYGGSDLKVHGLCFALLTEGWLGYHDQALKLSQEVLALAQKLSHPYSLATASLFVTWLHALRREAQATREMAEITINLSAEQGFPLWLASGTILRGWALAEQGQTAEGMAQIRQGLSDWRATGAEVCLSYLLALLAETYGKVGQVEGGLAVLAEALTTLEQTGERFWEAELYLLKGKLLLQAEAKAEALRQAQDEAEKCFWQAIDITRRQEARSLELRAVVSLSRLWQSQGKQVEAKQMLAEIYGWFTEGFETADLQEARTLLEELS